MGFQENGSFESDAKKWVIAGIPLRGPLKTIYTKAASADSEEKEEDINEECSTTPTGEESRIPTAFTCPPAPKKRKSTLKYRYNGVREFFKAPDLDAVFIRHVERA